MADDQDPLGEWVTSEDLATAAQSLSEVDSLRLQSMALRPLPGSRAAEDVGDPPLGELPLGYASHAWLLSADHVHAWHGLLVRAKIQSMGAHFTLARAAIEGAVMVRWLLEPGIEREERLWRAAAAQLEDHRQRRLFEESAGMPDARDGDGRSGRYRYDELVNRVKSARLWTRHGSQPVVPDMTRLFARYAIPGSTDGERVYRALSAFAHGKQWAAMMGEIHEHVPLSGTDMEIARLSSSDQVTADAASLTIAALRQALDEWTAYMTGVEVD